MFAIVDGPIDLAAIRAAVSHPACGAVLVFEGVARQDFDGKRVIELSYEAWVGPATRELEAIGREVGARWDGVRIAIVHRTGIVAIEAPSVVIAVSAPHREACYEASRYAIEALKARVPIWKKEIYADGSAWKANAG